jgi:hypothetical protein
MINDFIVCIGLGKAFTFGRQPVFAGATAATPTKGRLVEKGGASHVELPEALFFIAPLG